MANVNSDGLRSALFRLMAICLVAVLTWSCAASVGAGAGAGQEIYDSPQRAVDALIAAVRADQTADLIRIFGPEGKPLVYSGDPVADGNDRDKFVAAYDEMNKVVAEGSDRAVLVIGKDSWPFPIPLVKQGESWRFDTKAGAEEILDRRIGRNELSAIEVCRAYVDAQREYASRDHRGDGLLEYAQHFMSRSAKQDGLYWPVPMGEAPSPMGPLVASARAEGYPAGDAHAKREPYHGYYYRILKQQGKNAPGGAHDYVVEGRMIGGFALVAFPAQYGASGVMTFIVNQDGVVYQKNLGPDTATIAPQMTEFDPDPSWKALQ